MSGICKLIGFSKSHAQFEQNPLAFNGKLIPKDGKNWKVMILNDNPDINSITLEKKLTAQALREYEERLPYGIEVYDIAEYNLEFGIKFYNPEWFKEKFLTRIKETFEHIDVFIQFMNQENDEYFRDNVNAYGGFPNGSYKGIIRINNSRLWLDGQPILGSKAMKLGLIKQASPNAHLATNNYKRTIKHEFGHVIGEEHNEGVMSAFYDFDENMLGKTTLESLDNNYGLQKVNYKWIDWIKRVMIRPFSTRYI